MCSLTSVKSPWYEISHGQPPTGVRPSLPPSLPPSWPPAASADLTSVMGASWWPPGLVAVTTKVCLHGPGAALLTLSWLRKQGHAPQRGGATRGIPLHDHHHLYRSLLLALAYTALAHRQGPVVVLSRTAGANNE